MDFLKKNGEKLFLVLVALALLVFSVLIILKVRGFNETFESVRAEVVGNKEVETVDSAFLEAAMDRIQKPATWTQSGPLFNSRPYLEQDGKLINPEDEGYDIHPGVPNKWFIDNNLDLLDPNILSNDSDGDGFTNLEEWKGASDPQSKDKHPSYNTKLRLVEFISKPFRILFAAYTGDTFQINTIDVKQPTQFLKVGEMIKGTKFKIEAFEEKMKPNPRTGSMTDISELVLVNNETGEKTTLLLGVIGDSPDSFAVLNYLWDGSELKVKRGQDFTLPPQDEVRYKLIDINASQAVIQVVETGEKFPVLKATSP